MLYAVLCYNSEDSVFSWSKQEEEAVMGRLIAAQEKMAKAGRLGPVARLMPTTAATSPIGVISKIENAGSPCSRATPSTKRFVDVPISVHVPPRIAA